MPLWVAEGVLTDTELSVLRASGTHVTNLNYAIKLGDPTAMARAIETIKQHHPNQCVWVEAWV